MSVLRGSPVWVWDSIWLPAVVVRPTQANSILVRFEHGVTYRVRESDAEPRDPASRGGDTPAPRWKFRDELPMPG